MKSLTAPAALMSMLIVSTLAHSDEVARQALTVSNLEVSSSPDTVYADLDRPDDTSRVTGANDIYRAKIHDVDVARSDAEPRDPIEVFGASGYYLYDLDAWTMVSSGPVISTYRARPYSLFGSGLDYPALNALTMRSEYLRSNVSIASGSRASWSYAGWRF
jgi:hypothetical protein